MKVKRTLNVAEFERLLINIQKERKLIGPKLKDGAIIYDELESPEQMPRGLVDRQSPGQYYLENRQDQALFGYAVGPTSWKRFLDPPEQLLLSAKKTGNDFKIVPTEHKIVPQAFIGVRSCEMAALKIQDKVFSSGRTQNRYYQEAREKTLIVAVNCHYAADSCFCTSFKHGPHVQAGFDLLVTEYVSSLGHYLLVESGSKEGKKLLKWFLPTGNESALDKKKKMQKEIVVNNITRRLDSEKLRKNFSTKLDSPLWESVAKECLSCANCTLSCPTCFCSTVSDKSDLTGEISERWKTWDSCFTSDFSYIHGGSVRDDRWSRYRQWFSHKLVTWHDQFDESGCVGCGRCITWCPVGIDITQVAQELS